jgi:hypothetical protein
MHAQAGIQQLGGKTWISAFAGMTSSIELSADHVYYRFSKYVIAFRNRRSELRLFSF